MATTEKWAKLFKSRHQYMDSVPVQFGDAKDVAITWDGTNLTVKPVTDDTGAFIIGDGTTDMDFKVFMNTSSKYVLFDQSGSIVTFVATALTLGADTAGTDLKLFGATTGNYLLWDASEDDLTLVGTATQLAIAGTTAADSATTGSIHTAGGIGIAGALWVGTTSRLVGAVTSSAGISNTGDVASSVTMTTPSLRSASTGAVNLIINASSTGTIGIGSVSTGVVTITPATTITGAITASSTLGIAGKITSTSTTGISFNPTLVPDETRTNYIWSYGTRATAKDLAMAASASYNLDPIQVNLNIIGTAPTSSTVNLSYMNITHAFADMTGLRLKCSDWNISVAKDVQDVYVYQGEIDFNAAGIAVGGEAAVMGLVMNAGANAVTGNLRGLIISMQGAGSYASVVGLEIRTTCGDVLGHGCSEAIRIAGTPLPVVGIAMGNQTTDNEGPQYAFFFPSTGSPDTGPWSATNATGDSGKIAIKIGANVRYINVYTS